ncbi:hypothetical protein VTK26DRAFT_2806 [Humicola hyalothermophila]
MQRFMHQNPSIHQAGQVGLRIHGPAAGGTDRPARRKGSDRSATAVEECRGQPRVGCAPEPGVRLKEGIGIGSQITRVLASTVGGYLSGAKGAVFMACCQKPKLSDRAYQLMAAAAMETHTYPLFLSPALPSDLLQFIINRCAHPTTLIICCDRAEFLSSLAHDIHRQQQQPAPHEPQGPLTQPDTTAHRTSTIDPNTPPSRTLHPLLTSPLHTVATTRHIRTVFLPTVTHLRAFLSVFSLSPTSSSFHSKLPPPPPPPPASHPQPQPSSASPDSNPTTNTNANSSNPGPPHRHHDRPLLLIYNFLALHRNTSEWSIQGLGSSAAVLVEAARRTGLRAVVVEGREARRRTRRAGDEGAGEEQGDGATDRAGDGDGDGDGYDDGGGGAYAYKGMEEVLAEQVPVLSGSARRATGLGSEGAGGWAGRTLEVEKVLGRWFQFGVGEWDEWM